MTGGRSHAFAEISVPEAYERFMASELFEPCARELVRRVAPGRGRSALDVASGPGAVARLIANEVGDGGRVVASDISPAMLTLAEAKPTSRGAAPIEYLECSATDLPCADESFDLVVCQQGLQFFPDRLAALREMRRVLAAGGVAWVATWAAERPLGLLGPMVDAMRESGIPEPYPRAFDGASYAIGVDDLHQLMSAAGFADVQVETVELDCVWRSADDAVATIGGTPYGPLLAAAPRDQRESVLTAFRQGLGAKANGALTVRTASNIANGTKTQAIP